MNLAVRQGFSTGQTIALTPLFFGLAHVHHVHEYVVHQGQSLGNALLAVSHTRNIQTRPALCLQDRLPMH